MYDRLLSDLRAIVRGLLPNFSYYAVWEYRVAAIRSAVPPIALDLQPTGLLNPFGPQANLTLWPGPSGSVALPQVGSLARVAFADGDPGKPMIVGLDPASKPTMVFVGEDPSGEFAALASRVAQLQTAYNAHLHTGGTIAGNTGVPTVTSVVSFGSTKVQVPV